MLPMTLPMTLSTVIGLLPGREEKDAYLVVIFSVEQVDESLSLQPRCTSIKTFSHTHTHTHQTTWSKYALLNCIFYSMDALPTKSMNFLFPWTPSNHQCRDFGIAKDYMLVHRLRKYASKDKNHHSVHNRVILVSYSQSRYYSQCHRETTTNTNLIS